MKTWSVLKANGEWEPVSAESVYINAVSTLIFLEKEITPAPIAEPVPVDAPPKKKKTWKPKPMTITVRALPAGEWKDLRLIRE